MAYTHRFDTGEYKPRQAKGVLHISPDKIKPEFMKNDVEYGAVVSKARSLIMGQGQNAFQQIQGWRECGKKLIDAMIWYREMCMYALDQIDRYEKGANVNANKKWTPEEDEALIENVCGGVGDIEMSLRFGRSVPALKTRVSQLVGLNKISQEVAGKFLGTIDGKEIEGHIKGTVTKG